MLGSEASHKYEASRLRDLSLALAPLAGVYSPGGNPTPLLSDAQQRY